MTKATDKDPHAKSGKAAPPPEAPAVAPSAPAEPPEGKVAKRSWDPLAFAKFARSFIGHREATKRNDGPFVDAVLGETTKPGAVGNAWCAALAMRLYEWFGCQYAAVMKSEHLPVNFWEARAVKAHFERMRELGAVLAPGERPEVGDHCYLLSGVGALVGGTQSHMNTVVAVYQVGHRLEVECVDGNFGDATALTRHDAAKVSGFSRPLRLGVIAQA